MDYLKYSQPDYGSIYIYYNLKFPIIEYREKKSEEYKLNLDEILKNSEYPDYKEYVLVNKFMELKKIKSYSIVGLVFKKIKGYEKYFKYFLIEYGSEKNIFPVPVTQDSNNKFLDVLKEIKDNQNDVDKQMPPLDKDEDVHITKGGKKRKIKRKTHKRKHNKKRKTTKKR